MTSKQRKTAARRMIAVWAAVHVAMLAAWAVTRMDHLANPTLITVTGDFANLCAFHGLVLLVVMTLMGARNPSVERVFGLDKMMLAHPVLGYYALTLFALHAGFRTWSLSMEWGVDYQVDFLYRLGPEYWAAEWGVMLGRLAFLAMAAGAGLAVLGQKYLLLSYKAWKLPHLALYAAIPMGFAHALARGDDTPESAMLPLWAGLLVLFLYESVRRYRYVLHRRHHHVWTLDETVRESHDTASVLLDHPKAPGPFAHRRAGQFGVIRVPGVPHMDEPHPFTFSGPEHHQDGDQRLRMTVKVAGDFTAELLTLPRDTLVLVEGPYGVFLSDCREQERLVFLAGGVGVTPFLSALRSFRLRQVRIPTTLIWANKTREDILAAEELTAMTRYLPLRVHHVISREPPHVMEEHARNSGAQDTHVREPGVSYHSGRVGPELLLHCLTGDEAFYMCGPEPFMQAGLWGLKQAFDIPEHRVAREHFFW